MVSDPGPENGVPASTAPGARLLGTLGEITIRAALAAEMHTDPEILRARLRQVAEIASLAAAACTPGQLVLYHATPFADGFPYDEWVHAGTLHAASQRVGTTHAEDCGLPAGSPAVMHEIRVTGPVYPRVLTDEQACELWGAGHLRGLTEDGLPAGDGYAVFPYVNDAEDPGSLSYLVHRSAIRVLRSWSIPREVTAAARQ